MKFLTFTLLIVSLFASGTDPRGAEAQKLASAMGAQLDLSAAQRATDEWKASQTDYENVKGQVYSGVDAANKAVAELKDRTEKLDSAKDKKNVEDAKLEQTAVNYLAMQMIKERKATSEMAKERDEALEYVPNMKKHHQEQMQALKDAAVQEANNLQDQIKEVRARGAAEVDKKLKEIEEIKEDWTAKLDEEKGRVVKEQQNTVTKVQEARDEAAVQYNQLSETNEKLIEQNKEDIAQKDQQIQGLETQVEEVRNKGTEDLAAAKQAAEAEKTQAVQKVEGEKAEQKADYDQQLEEVKKNLADRGSEVSDLQGQLVEANAANQAAITKKQEETDAALAAMTNANKQKIQEVETQAKSELEAQLRQAEQISDNKVAQIEANYKTRMDNQQASSDSEIDRLNQRITRAEENYKKETEVANEQIAKNRNLENKVEELQDVIKQAKAASLNAQAFSQSLTNAVPATSVTGTAATVSQNELQVAEAQVQTAPINMKFVGVLVGVNALLACVAFTYYSESKRIKSFHASFLDEF